MVVNAATLSGVFTTLKTAFLKAFSNPARAPKWQKIATKVPSTTSQNDYAWLGAFPRFQEWIGPKAVKSLEAFSYSIKNRDFEATIAVKRNDIDDDNLGAYGIQAQDIGDSAAIWPDDLCAYLLNNGADASKGKCYDGKAFFAANHPGVDASGKKTTYSNKGDEVLSAATQAAAMAGFGAARTKLAAFCDDKGKLLGIRADTLVVPPALEDTANLLMTSDKLDDGKPNPYKGACTVEVWPELTDPKAWFVMDTKRRVKPLVFQERKKPTFVKQTSMENDDVFNLGEYKFGGEARGNAGYGLWQQAYMADGTADAE
ncbi:MAG: Mu-like prophage major head subunit gpT family protein [Kiritimatiellales bacterium]